MPDLHRVPIRLATLLATTTACCAAPAAGAQTTAPPPATGGASIPTVIAPSTGGSGDGKPGTRSDAAPTAVVGDVVTCAGLYPRAACRRIVLQRLDPRRGRRNVARARVRSTPCFAIGWRADRSGRISLRVALAQPRVARRRDRARRGRQRLPPGDGDVLRARLVRQRYVPRPGPDGRAARRGPSRLPCGTRVAIMTAPRDVVPVVDWTVSTRATTGTSRRRPPTRSASRRPAGSATRATSRQPRADARRPPAPGGYRVTMAWLAPDRRCRRCSRSPAARASRDPQPLAARRRAVHR